MATWTSRRPPLRSLAFLFGEFLQGLSQNRFLHLTYAVQVTISLLVLGIFFVLLIGAMIWWNKLGASMRVHVYLEDGLSAQDVVQMEEALGGIRHVSGIEYRSKEDAKALLASTNPEFDLELLDENPLPASFVLEADHASHLEGIADRVLELPGVMEVKYGRQMLHKYLRALVILAVICVATILLLVVFTSSSISNIIGMSVYARRTEIRIMQLVGATWWFIRWPFIFEGVFFGALGALLALAIIWLLLTMLAEALRRSDMALAMPSLGLDATGLALALGGVLLGLGVVVGLFGSLKTVNAFLGKETDIELDALKVHQLTR